MKTLILIVNASVYQALTDHLRDLDVAEFAVSHVEGHSAHVEADQNLSGIDRVVGFVPRVRVEVVLSAEQATSILEQLTTPGSILAGHGTFWISSVEGFGRF